MGPSLNVALGPLILLAIAGFACTQSEPTSTPASTAAPIPTAAPTALPTATPVPTSEPTATESRLEKRAQEWASHVSKNDWVTAFTTFAPELVEACGATDLVDFQQRILNKNPELVLSARITGVEVSGKEGRVYKKVTWTKRGVTFEDPTPDKWVLENGQWWYTPDGPDQRCVRYNPTFTPTSLPVSRDEFLSRFFSEIERIHPHVSFRDKDKTALLGFKFVSEEYEEIEGGAFFALLEQRLPRMQTVLTYEIPAPPIPGTVVTASTTLKLSGEGHALTRVGLDAYTDGELATNPWIQSRQETYFRALGEVLAPEWIGDVDFYGWFEREAVREGTGLEGELGPMTINFWQHPTCSRRTDPGCPSLIDPPRILRWQASFKIDTGPRTQQPPPSCDENPELYYIWIGNKCP